MPRSSLRRPNAARALRAAPLALAAALAGAAPAAAEPEIRLPPGTRTDAAGQRLSGRGLRDTTDFLARELARKGIAVQQIGPYRVRGVELTRFLSQSPSTSWLAIHVVRSGGRTMIYFVARAPLDETPRSS